MIPRAGVGAKGDGVAGSRVDRAVAGLMVRAAARPWAVLGLMALALVLALIGAARLGVDTDSSRMLAPDLPFQTRAAAVNAAFPGLRGGIVVVVHGPPGAADRATAAVVRALDGAPGVEAVFAPAVDPFFRRNGLLYADRAAVADQVTRLGLASELIANLRTRPTLEGFFEVLAAAAARGADLGALQAEVAAVIAAGGARDFDWTAALGGDPGPVTRVITVTPALDFARLSPAGPAIAAVRAAVAGVAPDLARAVEIGVTGDPVLRAEELASVREGLGLGQVVSLVLVAGLLALALRSARRAALGVLVLVVSVVLTAGVAGWVVGTLNLISIAFVVIMIGMGVEYALHLLAHLGERPGLAVRAAVARSGAGIGGALVLSATTTAAAFLAFATTDFRGMAQLGVIGGLGVLIACAVAVTLIPAVVALAPGLVRGPATVSGGRAPRHPAWAVWVALGLGGAAALVAPLARFEADPMRLRDQAAPSVQAYQRLAGDPRTQPVRLSVLTTPAEAPALAEALRALPEVGSVTTLADLVPGDQAEKLALIDLAYPALVHAVEGAALDLGAPAPDPGLAVLARTAAGPARAAIETALFAGFPDLLDRIRALGMAGPVAVDDLPAALRARYLAADGRQRVEIAPRDDPSDPQAMARFVAAVQGVAPGAAGPPDTILGAGAAVGAAMLQAGALILAAAAGLTYAFTGRLRAVAAVLVPLGLAALVTLAFGVLAGVPFNFANVIVLPLMIGIGIDGGVHLALRAREGAGLASSTPRAILFSALTSIAAFGTLALSPHPGTASMGLMLTVALTAAMAMIFALTPAIMGRGGDGRPG